MPPPAEGFVPRLLLGPALRAQPDRRLVMLVREGYEAAFEEIVRRYRQPLRRYAAGIVGTRSEDVTQDAFSKALLALRRDGAEIELRPWLYRIVRNTALNDLRDNPEAAAELAEAIAGGRTPAEVLEERERLADLIKRLQALPEPQRAAIVMRELEGLGHDEIAATLGLSGGAARQAIYRARQALREGLGILVPLPLMKTLLEGIGPGAAESAAGTASVAGAGMALKATAATVLVAGAVGAGIAVERPHRSGDLQSPVGLDRAIAGGPAGEGAASAGVSRRPSAAGEEGGERGSERDDTGEGSRADGHGGDPGRDAGHGGHRHGSSREEGRRTGDDPQRGGGEGRQAGGGGDDSRHEDRDEPRDDDGSEHDGEDFEGHGGEEPDEQTDAGHSNEGPEEDGSADGESPEEEQIEHGESEQSDGDLVDSSSEVSESSGSQ